MQDLPSRRQLNCPIHPYSRRAETCLRQYFGRRFERRKGAFQIYPQAIKILLGRPRIHVGAPRGQGRKAAKEFPAVEGPRRDPLASLLGVHLATFRSGQGALGLRGKTLGGGVRRRILSRSATSAKTRSDQTGCYGENPLKLNFSPIKRSGPLSGRWNF
jgi:hypothetical protein